MRTTIPWGDGSGDNIYLDYTAASGDQTIQVSSDANAGSSSRTKNITFSATGVQSVVLTVIQAANESDLIVISYNGYCVTRNDVAVGYEYEIPSGFRKLTGIVFDGQVYYNAGYKLKGSDTFRISFKVSKACNICGCYTTASATNNYSLYATATSGGKYARYGSGTYNSYIVVNTRYDVVMSPTGIIGLTPNDSWSALTFEATNNMLIGTTSTGATSAKLTGTVYGDVIVDQKVHLVPCERISDGAIGYYDIFSKTFKTNQGSGTPTALGYA